MGHTGCGPGVPAPPGAVAVIDPQRQRRGQSICLLWFFIFLLHSVTFLVNQRFAICCLLARFYNEKSSNAAVTGEKRKGKKRLLSTYQSNLVCEKLDRP